MSTTPTAARTTERRWMKSMIAASAEPLPSFPWVGGARRAQLALTLAHAIPAKTPRMVQPVKPRRVTLAAH